MTPPRGRVVCRVEMVVASSLAFARHSLVGTCCGLSVCGTFVVSQILVTCFALRLERRRGGHPHHRVNISRCITQPVSYCRKTP